VHLVAVVEFGGADGTQKALPVVDELFHLEKEGGRRGGTDGGRECGEMWLVKIVTKKGKGRRNRGRRWK
jgi:hypothetical protein